MDIIKAVEAEQLKDNPENFNVGDTVKVHYRIVEGTTERIQIYEGLVIAKANAGLRRTFTVKTQFPSIVEILLNPNLEQFDLENRQYQGQKLLSNSKEHITANTRLNFKVSTPFHC